jgi:hypothetical protein
LRYIDCEYILGIAYIHITVDRKGGVDGDRDWGTYDIIYKFINSPSDYPLTIAPAIAMQESILLHYHTVLSHSSVS